MSWPAAKPTFGVKQSVLDFKKFEMKNLTEEKGTNASGRADYKVGEVSLNGKTIGSGALAMSLKNLDIPATLSLMQIYQTKLQPYERAAAEAAAAGLPAPELKLTEAEEAQLKSSLEKLLAAGPQVALENLSFNTANGESRANMVLDLTKPQVHRPADRSVGQAADRAAGLQSASVQTHAGRCAHRAIANRRSDRRQADCRPGHRHRRHVRQHGGRHPTGKTGRQ